ncbi:MAG TPA: hypothetical protein VJ767_12125 [Nitrososphaeraceae archaeon]|jgi:hypothetical protein|nr:hypothetical protein [Nitrososphaeraceae archaeon]
MKNILIFDDDHDTSLRYRKWFDSLPTGDHLLMLIYVIEGEPESELSVTNVNEIFINIRL